MFSMTYGEATEYRRPQRRLSRHRHFPTTGVGSALERARRPGPAAISGGGAHRTDPIRHLRPRIGRRDDGAASADSSCRDPDNFATRSSRAAPARAWAGVSFL